MTGARAVHGAGTYPIDHFDARRPFLLTCRNAMVRGERGGASARIGAGSAHGPQAKSRRSCWRYAYARRRLVAASRTLRARSAANKIKVGPYHKQVSSSRTDPQAKLAVRGSRLEARVGVHKSPACIQYTVSRPRRREAPTAKRGVEGRASRRESIPPEASGDSEGGAR
ncbi:hypothetical protein BV20DRAFT_545900 [Pilatotrama ljubarskyi]|nr:hypothetical protein BV20DRAFT_545900 [Pilatotrama ljubarskyi]